MSGLILHKLHQPDDSLPPLTVHFVYPTQHLKEREVNTFRSYWAIQRLAGRVKFHVGLSELKTAVKQLCDVIILDECDDFIFT